MKKVFLWTLMVVSVGSMLAAGDQSSSLKPTPTHVKEMAKRHHLYVLGIAITLFAAGCSYKFLLPRLIKTKKLA